MKIIFVDAVFFIFLRLSIRYILDMNETELVKQCGKGNNLARKQLYEQYAGQLLAICIRYTSDREVAQDILHDAFLKIFHSIDSFVCRGEGALKAWMVRIVMNESLNYLRQQSAFLSREMPVDDIPEMEDPTDEQLDEIPSSVLLKFIEELPPGYRTVFNLYVLEEKSHKEIAQLLGISEHSSSSQLSRAKALLVKKINHYRKNNNDEER